MRNIVRRKFLIILISTIFSCTSNSDMKMESFYKVSKLKQPLQIDGNWNKPQWQNIGAAEINHYMGEIPKFQPVVHAKMMYDDENLYVIFQVKDRYVRCVTKDYNGPVYEDACVELFFAPDTAMPERYFNLEINCGGTPLMYYNIIPRKDYKILETDDLKKIEIAHSMPQLVDPEVTEPVTWTVEYRLPLTILEKFSNVTPPKKGISWRANFYKTSDKGSNPHWITWSFINNPVPDFHLPKYFGEIKFE